MTEASLTAKAHEALKVGCPRVKIYKLNDRATSGLPDSVLAWDGYTTWLEFKHLDAREDLHATPTGTRGLKKLQLMELIALEQQNGGRAWVVNYRKAGKDGQHARLEVYRPSALVQLAEGGVVVRVTPRAERWSTRDSILRDLHEAGVAWFDGYQHAALVTLVQLTHGAQS